MNVKRRYLGVDKTARTSLVVTTVPAITDIILELMENLVMVSPREETTSDLGKYCSKESTSGSLVCICMQHISMIDRSRPFVQFAT